MGFSAICFVYNIPFLANYPLRVAIATLSESILRKTFFLEILRIPHTHGVFRHFSTSLRRVPRRWRGPAADGATPGGRSVSPKVLEPVHFGAKHRRRKQYLTVHNLVIFFRHSNGRPEHDLGLRFVGIQIWLKLCTLSTRTQIFKKMGGDVAQNISKRHEIADAASPRTPGSFSRPSSSGSSSCPL